MGLMIDARDLAWKDNDSANIVRIIDFSQNGEIHLVWYMDVESLEEHCMDIDAFLSKHTTGGLFNDYEPA